MNIPFGIERYPHGRNPIPQARLAGLWTFPGPILWCPTVLKMHLEDEIDFS